MKKAFIIVACCWASAAFCQKDTLQFPAMDKSPMDMCYYPDDYPVLKISDKASEPLLARVIYGRPQKNGREIFGDIVEYGKVWRLGANEATEIEFFKDVKISGKKIPKGRYTLYAIPRANDWTMIINKDTDIWGAFRYNEKNDVQRISVPVVSTAKPVETLSMAFKKHDASEFDLVIAWDTKRITMPVSLK